MSYALLRRLWRAEGKAELLALLDKIPHETRHIAGRVNNIGECELATNGYAALIESITNGHDAVIRDALACNLFASRPATVVEALQLIASEDLKVHLYFQQGGGTHNRTITIVDQGIGMSETGMLGGVLTFGSEDKVLDPLQHGNYGMGGATLYGQSSISLILSKTREGDRYYFTVVYKFEPDEDHLADSYLYIVRPDGHLFSFDIKDLGEHAVPAHNDFKANRNNLPIIPAHGTVRRQWGMDVDYWGYHKSSLFTAIPDRMFGSPGVIRLIGDDNEGRLNKRRGRRWDLEAVPVGGKLQNGAEMLYKRVGVPITLYDRREALGEVLISVWIVSPWGEANKPKKTPVLSMLDGDEKGAPFGIMATINGQTHGRLRSTIPFRNAGISNLTNLTIIQVELDRLPRAVRRKFASSDRNHIDDVAAKKLEGEITDLLLNDVEVQDLSRRRESIIPPIAIDIELQRLSNEMMDNPLLGMLAGVDTPSHQKMRVHTRSKVHRERKSPPPFEPRDPPTSITIATASLTAAKTNWLTIKTDAPDAYADRFRCFLPPFVEAVPDSIPRLRKGNYTQQVKVLPGYKVGDRGTMTAVLALPDSLLTDQRDIELVPERPQKRGTADGPMREIDVETNTAFPSILVAEVDGAADEQYPALFGSIDESMAAINWKLSPDNSLTVYVNKKNTLREHARTVMQARYKTDADILLEDFRREMVRYFMALAMLYCRVDDFDPAEASSQSNLSRVIQGHSITTMHRYSDAEFRKIVLKRAKSAD